LPGVSIRVGGDGEIQISGESVLTGYHQNEKATKESFDGDWFLTGDVGELDDDGYLSITDRKKELIVTANGKNVAPSPLEQRIAAHRIVASAMVVGDRRPFLAALITLDPDEVGDRPADSDDVRREVQAAIDDANRSVSRAESIREFVVLDRDFTLEEDELTSTMKLRRTAIAEHFADEIDSIYADPR
jgi:long-chain acyl-CoA synthetase